MSTFYLKTVIKKNGELSQKGPKATDNIKAFIHTKNITQSVFFFFKQTPFWLNYYISAGFEFRIAMHEFFFLKRNLNIKLQSLTNKRKLLYRTVYISTGRYCVSRIHCIDSNSNYTKYFVEISICKITRISSTEYTLAASSPFQFSLLKYNHIM